MDELLARHRVTIRGVSDAPTVIFSHGFGCDQSIWDEVTPAFEATHRVVTFDHAGCGVASRAPLDVTRHATLDGYVQDLVAIGRALGLRGATLVGHSVGGTLGLLTDVAAPELFDDVVVIGSSARYLDDDGYHGGFARQDVDDLLTAIDDNYAGWSVQMAPVIIGHPDQPELAERLAGTFTRQAASSASIFARATFLADARAALPDVTAQVHVLHCTDDAIVPDVAAHYLSEHLPRSTFTQLQATGHCPLLSAPQEVISTVRRSLPQTRRLGAA